MHKLEVDLKAGVGSVKLDDFLMRGVVRLEIVAEPAKPMTATITFFISDLRLKNDMVKVTTLLRLPESGDEWSAQRAGFIAAARATRRDLNHGVDDFDSLRAEIQYNYVLDEMRIAYGSKI